MLLNTCLEIIVEEAVIVRENKNLRMSRRSFRKNQWDRRNRHRCNRRLRGNRPVLHGLPPASQPFRAGINWLIRTKFLRFSGKSCLIAARLRPFQTISFLSLHASFPSLFIWWKENSDCFSSNHRVSITIPGTKVKAKNSPSCHISEISFAANVFSPARGLLICG